MISSRVLDDRHSHNSWCDASNFCSRDVIEFSDFIGVSRQPEEAAQLKRASHYDNDMIYFRHSASCTAWLERRMLKSNSTVPATRSRARKLSQGPSIKRNYRSVRIVRAVPFCSRITRTTNPLITIACARVHKSMIFDTANISPASCAASDSRVVKAPITVVDTSERYLRISRKPAA